MSTDTRSPKTKVAANGPHEARTTPAQPNAQEPSEAKDTETLFWEAFERASKETLEEHYEKFPFLKNITPGTGVDPDKGMQILEEMERQEAALPDGTETTGADKIS